MTAWTERVQVGTATLLLPLYHPVVVAKQLADLDAHSRGRLCVGVGVGGEFPKEFESVGIPLNERGARMDESIDVLRSLWSGKPVSHDGRFFRFDDITMRAVLPLGETASPGTPGGPPIIISGRREAAMRRAARVGDGWMPYLFSPSAYARSVQFIRDEAQANGRDLTGFRWTAYLYTSIRHDGDKARGDVEAFLGSAYGDRPPEMLDRIAPAGTPEEVAGRIQEYVDAGAREIIISPASHQNTLEVVQLAAREVLPRLVLPTPAT
jgi:alkanesulfonate monooxygenase SsuD/methylene tetrahydromethanopterin reductase-like flavin-dependent oxidoreductase (luciferase family)